MSQQASDIALATGVRTYQDYLNAGRSVNQELGKTEFLQLIAAQLQYQDPLEPVKDSDFVAQLAQFSSLQQLESLSNLMSSSYYYSLPGKYVYAEVRLDDGTNMDVFGIVDRIIMKDGRAFAQVTMPEGVFLVDATKISEVYDEGLFSADNSLLNHANIIGCTVQANIEVETTKVVGEGDEATEETVKEIQAVSGVVERVYVDKGIIMATIKDENDELIEVPTTNIFDIRR